MKTKKYILLVLAMGVTSIANAKIEASIIAHETNKIGATITCRAQCVRLPNKEEVKEEEATYEWNVSDTVDFQITPTDKSIATVKRVNQNGSEFCNVFCNITVDNEFDSANKALSILGWE